LLQPLVENAVKYSFQKNQEAQVAVHVCCEKDYVRLSVADNGPGMPPELVKELAAESASAQLHQVLDNRNRHIGLRNVLARCQLYYGTQFTFTIESGEETGTIIELILPVQEGKQ
jgi:two-component system sensor histidine kinase YesM